MIDALVAISLANLFFLSVWVPCLYVSFKGYFNKVAVTWVTLTGLLANFLGFAFVAWLAMRLARRFQNRRWIIVFNLLFLAVLLVPVDFCRSRLRVTDTQIVALLTKPLGAVCGVALLIVIVWQHRHVTRAAAVVVAILFPLALFTFVKTAVQFVAARHESPDSDKPAFASLKPVSPDQPRIVWLLFDETDQRLAFDERPAGVALPELDRFRRESLVATNAFPPGDATLISVPSLISGRVLSEVSIQNASNLKLTLADNGTKASWTELPSVFSLASSLGFNTAVVGWYHPYFRLFGHELNYCTWHPWHPAMFYEPGKDTSFCACVENQLGCVTGSFYMRRLYVDLCRDILPEALEVVTNNNYGLVFLHLPPPHKPGIYLPAQHKLTMFGMSKVRGYFNNLALADDWFGALRSAMDHAGVWDKTWVILSSDHSWRESMAYDGHRDLRVPFIIKAPFGGPCAVYSQRINTVITAQLISSILHGQINDLKQVASWLDAQKPSRMAQSLPGGQE